MMRETGIASSSVKPSQSAQGPIAARAATQQADEPRSLSLSRWGGNQFFLSVLGRTAIQPRLRVGPAGDRFEEEADRAAAVVVGSLHSNGAPPALSPLTNGQAIQRKCAKCEEEEEEGIRRSPRDQFATVTGDDVEQEGAQEVAAEPVASEPTPAETTTEETPAPEDDEPVEARPSGLLVDDDNEDVAVGQMQKSDFLEALRPAVCDAVDAGLAGTGRTSEGCPHVEYWFGHLAGKTASFVERGIQRFAPETVGATSAADYIPAVAIRVLTSTQAWVRTGEVQGVPDEFGGLVSGETPPPADEGSGKPRVAVQFKSRLGGARQPEDPAAVRDELGSGRPLDGGVRAQMESAYGTSFANVRIHDDASGARLSDQFNARAFTVGEHVAFGTGEYRPRTLMGDALLAHELAHVVQQHGAVDESYGSDAATSDANLEEDADRSMLSGLMRLSGRALSDTGELIRLAAPRLHSGLRLSRCKSNTAPSPTVKPKLTKKTISGPTTGDCGVFNWVVQWELDQASPSGGWVVQKVELPYNVTDCAGTAINPAAAGGLQPSWYPLWEAWQINKGKKVTTYAEGGDVLDDTYGSTSPGASTKGSVSVKGTADYYEGLTLPNSFTVTNAKPTWILPATKTDPSLSGGSGAISHDLNATWDCCTADKTTKITTV